MKTVDNISNSDYVHEIEKYLSNLSVAEYQKYIEFCLRAPSDMRVLISEVLRLRNDIDRYREDISELRKEVLERDRLVNEFRPKANKYDRMIERLQPSDGGKYVNNVIEAFWRYLRDIQLEEPGQMLDRAKIEKSLESDVIKMNGSQKRNTPILDIKRVDQDQNNEQEENSDNASDEITKPSK